MKPVTIIRIEIAILTLALMLSTIAFNHLFRNAMRGWESSIQWNRKLVRDMARIVDARERGKGSEELLEALR